MADEQIIQRLEEHKRGAQIYIGYDLLEETINLINRREAKIKKLEEQCTDKERAYNEEFCLRKELKAELKTTKIKAIKEFAGRLKEIIYMYEDRTDVDGIVILTRIDNSIDKLVKEMTEVK